MYTLNGTLPEVCAFLEGYYSGICKGGGTAIEFANSYWFDFLLHMHDELGCNGSDRSWQDIVSTIEKRIDGQEKAIEFTLQHYREYLVVNQLVRHG